MPIKKELVSHDAAAVKAHRQRRVVIEGLLNNQKQQTNLVTNVCIAKVNKRQGEWRW